MPTKKVRPKFSSAFDMQDKIDYLLHNIPRETIVPHFNWFDLDMLSELILGRLDEQYIIFAETPIYDDFTYGCTGKIYAAITKELNELVDSRACGDKSQDTQEQLQSIDDLLHELMHYCVKSGFRAGCRLGRKFRLDELINIED